MFGSPSCTEDPAVLSLRALQCALHIQDEYKQYDSKEGFILTLHVGTFMFVRGVITFVLCLFGSSFYEREDGCTIVYFLSLIKCCQGLVWAK